MVYERNDAEQVDQNQQNSTVARQYRSSLVVRHQTEVAPSASWIIVPAVTSLNCEESHLLLRGGEEDPRPTEIDVSTEEIGESKFDGENQ